MGRAPVHRPGPFSRLRAVRGHQLHGTDRPADAGALQPGRGDSRERMRRGHDMTEHEDYTPETARKLAARLIEDPELPWIVEPEEDDPVPPAERLAEEPAEVEAE